jgi:hypothetical protein
MLVVPRELFPTRWSRDEGTIDPYCREGASRQRRRAGVLYDLEESVRGYRWGTTRRVAFRKPRAAPGSLCSARALDDRLRDAAERPAKLAPSAPRRRRPARARPSPTGYNLNRTGGPPCLALSIVDGPRRWPPFRRPRRRRRRLAASTARGGPHARRVAEDKGPGKVLRGPPHGFFFALYFARRAGSLGLCAAAGWVLAFRFGAAT